MEEVAKEEVAKEVVVKKEVVKKVPPPIPQNKPEPSVVSLPPSPPLLSPHYSIL